MTESSEGRGPLLFSTLGPLMVQRDIQTLRLGGRQQRAVLAVLVVQRRVAVSLGRMADEIWGEQLPAGYVRTLQTYVHHLREVLEPDHDGDGRREWGVLRTVDGGYQLMISDEAVDATAFEAIVRAGHESLATDPGSARENFEQALAMWRGEPLSDLTDFPFVATYAARLHEIRLTALEGLNDARLALGDHLGVLADVRGLVAAHPLRERFHAQHMLALYRGGRQADALAAYRSLHRVLDEDLGVEPQADIRRLHEAILRQDPALEAAGATTPATVGGEPDGDRVGTSASQEVAPPRRADRRRLAAASAVLVVALGAGTVAFGPWHQRARSLSALPPNSVATITTDRTLVHAISVPANPSAIAYGDGSVWVAGSSDGVVWRISTDSHDVTQRIPVGQAPTGIAITSADAWVTNAGDGTVSRINLETDQVVQTIPVGAVPASIAAGPSGVWVANSGEDTIERIDPKTAAVGRPIAVGGRPDGVAVGAGSVWVANGEDATVSRIDPASGQPIGGPIAVGAAPAALVVAGRDLWVADSGSQSVDRIDAATGQSVQRITVGDGPVSLAAAGGRLWTANAYDGTVSEIDTRTNQVRPRVYVGASPRAMVPVGASVWVASGAFASANHFGGTLVVAAKVLPASFFGFDPVKAFGRDDATWIAHLTDDGLVSYHYTGGPGGLTIVPDLATTLPRPSDGERTWSFTVRSGVRFSDGTTVKPTDIQRGVKRALVLQDQIFGGPTAISTGIVGTEHCPGSWSRCDLSKGVIADDTNGTVVFHLNQPDPNFLYKLAYFGYAAPASAPTTESPTKPIPGTGPYVIADLGFDLDTGLTQRLVLRRNPYFKQWSFAAQPRGYPDEIRWVKEPNYVAVVNTVASDASDLGRISGNFGADVGRRLDEVQQEMPARVHVEGSPQVSYFLLNPRIAPFTDVRVRRAFSLAIDRRRIAALEGSPLNIVPQCQTLPPNISGYEPYCPYSSAAPDQPYAGPDLASAEALVAASHRAGSAITVYYQVVSDTDTKVGQYLVGVLRSLHFRARLQPISQGDWFSNGRAYQARLQDVGGNGWIADFPAASNIYFNTYSCATQATTCNAALDLQAKAARGFEGSDPAQARTMWAAIDKELTNSATVVGLTSLRQAFVVSQRVGNFQSNPLGPLLSQIWVK